MMLESEVAELDATLSQLVPWAAPRTISLRAIGVDHAGHLLVTAGERPERLRSEAAFAHLCGVSPIPASSGRTQRHRLHRAADEACIWQSLCACAAAHALVATSNVELKRASPSLRSCAA